MKKISFIVPVYNCKAYLTDCVESIRAVDAENYELLLIDDGSTDGSGVLCDAFAEQYTQIHVIHQPNSGASAARNRGILESSGERLLFIDADDSLDAGALRKVLNDPRCVEADLVIFGLTFDYYHRGKCYRQDSLFYEQDGLLPTEEWGSDFAELFTKNALSPVWNKVFRRDILIKHQLELNQGMFLYEDLEFVLRYLHHCNTIWNVPQAIYHYRQSEDEGNAKRRLARISSIPEFLIPIEVALTDLLCANPAISKRQTDAILQQLYLTLAREKISTSDLTGIREICQDFFRWAQAHGLPLEETNFQKRLSEQKAMSLLLADKKTALRHKVAVWVKSHLRNR
ncbi:MAG: glycosyltransferase family 2 protein [Oscillospiraceae bacterium]|nr:glycosyltransferase family 2 protein [Oscillospiraceae bacterium]